jgi:hypothetical protein
MDSTTWILTTIGGILVGVVILFLEYRYFKSRRGMNDLSSSENGEINKSWTMAVDTAIESLKISYPSSEVRMIKRKVEKGIIRDSKAILCVEIKELHSAKKGFYMYIETDKSGDLIKVLPWGMPDIF